MRNANVLEMYLYIFLFAIKLYLLSTNFYFPIYTGTSVLQVTATDADDPTYGNSARVVYSILQGQPYFSVDPKTGECFTYLSM